MDNVIDLIISNRYYLIITACILAAAVFFIIKKMLKLFIYAFIALIAFFAYAYYTGKSIGKTIEPAKDAIKKAEKVIK